MYFSSNADHCGFVEFRAQQFSSPLNSSSPVHSPEGCVSDRSVTKKQFELELSKIQVNKIESNDNKKSLHHILSELCRNRLNYNPTESNRIESFHFQIEFSLNRFAPHTLKNRMKLSFMERCAPLVSVYNWHFELTLLRMKRQRSWVSQHTSGNIWKQAVKETQKV